MRTATSRNFLWVGLALPALVAAALLAGAAGVFLVMALGFALALALRIQQPDERQLVARLADGALLAIPGALVVVFAFNGGGFFPQAPAVVAVALSGVLVARVLFARDPFEGFGPLLVTAAAALFLYCGWCLLSLTWSHAPGRAFVESDRALLYVLVVVLFGSIARDSRRIAWAVRGAVLGIVVVCTCALITRVLPDVWPIGPNIYENRLAYPITYWNTLGLLAAIGCVLALHLTCSLREAAWMRVAAAASIPVLATTLLFTFSRGAIGAGIIGLAAYILLGRSRGLIGGLLATVPPTAIALVAAYRADLLATNTPTTAAATAQGHRVALLVAVCVACAAVLRAVCLRLDDRVERVRLAPATTRAVRTGLAATVLAALVFLLAAGAPHWIGSQYHRFLSTKAPDAGGKTTRQRLTDPSNNGRLANWKVALREFRGSALHGDGAGTYALAWAIHRPADFGPYQVVNAHSLYIENLSDLGIVGLALILVLLGAILYGIARRIRGPGRSLYAALLAVTITWAFEAGLDWQWQMPVVTALVLSLGALALARARREDHSERRVGTAPRAIAAVACLAVAVMPLLVGISQSHLDDAVAAIKARDCRKAEHSARASTHALGFRPEPYEVLGYCAIQDGQPAAAVADFRRAVSHDPRNWEYRYGLAVARAAAGQDPSPDLRASQRLGPYQVLPDDAVQLFSTRDPRLWQRRALLAPLPDQLTS